jgi:hypothetical protein
MVDTIGAKIRDTCRGIERFEFVKDKCLLAFVGFTNLGVFINENQSIGDITITQMNDGESNPRPDSRLHLIKGAK